MMSLDVFLLSWLWFLQLQKMSWMTNKTIFQMFLILWVLNVVFSLSLWFCCQYNRWTCCHTAMFYSISSLKWSLQSVRGLRKSWLTKNDKRKTKKSSQLHVNVWACVRHGSRRSQCASNYIVVGCNNATYISTEVRTSLFCFCFFS